LVNKKSQQVLLLVSISFTVLFGVIVIILDRLVVVLTGFIIGRTVGVISFLPGGLGTQDASTVGVYATYGVPLAQGALAYILFRIIYYFIPFVISLGFYRRLLRS
jgi:phosphatidylglycerol lysyltransferase